MDVQQKYQRSGLWSVTIEPTETSHEAACQAVRCLKQDAISTPHMTRVAHADGVSLWRAEFSGVHMPTSLTDPCHWLSLANLPPRKRCYRPHFEVLTYFED